MNIHWYANIGIHMLISLCFWHQCLILNNLLMQLWSLWCLSFVESGSSITASCIGLGCSRTPPAGTAGKAVPGYNGEIPRHWHALYLFITNSFSFIAEGLCGRAPFDWPFLTGWFNKWLKYLNFLHLCLIVTVIDDEMQPVKPRTLGNIVVKWVILILSYFICYWQRQ